MSLKENDIRPSDLDEGKLKALKEDLERLHSKQDKFVLINCNNIHYNLGRLNVVGFVF